MDVFMDLLPLIVGVTGLAITCLVMVLFTKEVFDLETETQLTIIAVLLILTIVGGKVTDGYRNNYYSEKDENYYAEIETLSRNGYTVYVDGSAIDFDKIVISDYPIEKIHINDERKEIYISAGTENN